MGQTKSSISIEWRLFQYRFVGFARGLDPAFDGTGHPGYGGMQCRSGAGGDGGVVQRHPHRSHVWRESGACDTDHWVFLAVPSIILLGINVLMEREGFVIPSYCFALLFLSYVIAILMNHLFTAHRFSANTISGALSAYLLIGVLWAVLCSLLEIFQPGSYEIHGDDAAPCASCDSAANTLFIGVLQFCDLDDTRFWSHHPGVPLARLFTALEALTGQVYLVVLVAWLVGLRLQIAQSIQKFSPPRQ